MNSVTFNVARAVGPVAGALVVARLGIAWAIALNGAGDLAFAAAMIFVRLENRQETSKRQATIRESVRMIARDPALMTLLAVVAAVSITIDPVSTLTPAFATRFFHRPDT